MISEVFGPAVIRRHEQMRATTSFPLRVEHGDFHGVHARWQDLFRDEAAVFGNGHLAARHVDLVARRDRVAAHGDRAARERDIAEPELVLARFQRANAARLP